MHLDITIRLSSNAHYCLASDRLHNTLSPIHFHTHKIGIVPKINSNNSQQLSSLNRSLDARHTKNNRGQAEFVLNMGYIEMIMIPVCEVDADIVRVKL